MTWPVWAKTNEKGLGAYVVEATASRLRLETPTADLLAKGDLTTIIRELYDAFLGLDIRWSPDLYVPDDAVQAVRPPEDILDWAGDGTCLDLALLMAGAALGKGLLPVVVVLNGHALVAISRHTARAGGATGARSKREGGQIFADGLLTGEAGAQRLLGLVDSDEYLMVECTGFARAVSALSPHTPEGIGRTDGLMPFDRATSAGKEQLTFERDFVFAIDVAYLLDVAHIDAHQTEAAGLARVNDNLRRRQERLLGDYRFVVGRDEELAFLDDVVAQGPPGYCLVTGDPGTGKTALLAEWVRRLKERRDLRTIYYFISRPDGSAASQSDFLQSLVGQGAWAWGRRMEASGGVLNLEAAWLELLDPGRPPAKPVVIVIDGADECDGWALPKSSFPIELPPGVHVIVSARGDQETWRDALGLRNPRPLGLFAFGAASVRAILDAAGAPRWLLEEEAFELLLDRVQGDPFYVRLVCDEVLRGGINDLADLTKVEPGLKKYLESWWADLGPKAGDAAVKDLLIYLSVALAPMSRAELTDVRTDDALDWASFPSAYDAVRRYVRGDPGDAGIAFAHWRLRDYISAFSDDDRSRATATVIAWCERWSEHHSRYALTRTISHYLREARARTGKEQATYLQASIELIRDPAFQQARVDKARDGSGLVADFNEITALLATVQPTDADGLLTMSLEFADARQRWLQPAAVFELARNGDWEEAASRLDLLAASDMWRAVAKLSIAWLASDVTGAAVQPLLDADRIGVPVLAALADRVRRWVSGDLTAPTEDDPDESDESDGSDGSDGLSAGGLLDRARAVLAHMSDGERFEGLADLEYYGMVGSKSFGVEAEAPVLAAAARAYPGPGTDLLEQYIDFQGANPYADYRNRALGEILRHVAQLPDGTQARRLTVLIAQSALSPSPVQFCDYLYLSIERRKEARTGNPTPTLVRMARRLEEEAELVGLTGPGPSGPPSAHLMGHAPAAGAPDAHSDLWSFLRRRIAMTAETLALVGEHEAAGRLLDRATLFVQGFAGYRAPAYLTLAEANLIVRPDRPAARQECIDRAFVAAHNIQDPPFCARTTAMVNALALRVESEDLAGEVESFAGSRSARATQFGSIHRVGEQFANRTPRDHVPIDPVTAADTLDVLAREVFSMPIAALETANPDLPRTDRLAPGTAVVLPDPAYVPVLAARLSAEVLASALPTGDKTVLIARLVPVALSSPTALDTVLARLIAVAPTLKNEDHEVLKVARTYETYASSAYAEANEQARYGVS